MDNANSPHFVITQNHILAPARFLVSPNCNNRPSDAVISLLVIHNISLPPGIFTGDAVEKLFLNKLDCAAHPYYESLKDLKVSTHLFIRRTGEVIQFVPFNKRAWHAGASNFDGVPNCNDYSIGIELEGSDSEAFTKEQYLTLVPITRCLMQKFPAITLNRIVGHSDIAPHRKTDPGPFFNWDEYKRQITA